MLTATNTNRKQQQRVGPRFETLRHLLAADIPTRDYLVAPWMKQGESALLYAAPGVGKSMLTLSLALAVAGGGSFLGWTVETPRRVLFVDGEMNRADIKERAAALLPSIAGVDAEAVRDNFVLHARHGQHADFNFPDLATPEGQKFILGTARRTNVDLLVLDNFSTLVTCEDENAAAAFNDIVKFLLRVKQANIACLLVHHTNKTGGDYRGSSKLATTFEVIIGLRKGSAAGDTRDDGPTFELEWDKFRGKHRDQVTMIRKVGLRENPDKGLYWVTEKAPKAHVEELVAAVKSMRFATQDELADHFGVTKGTISKWKTAAIHDHRLIMEHSWNRFMEQAAASRSEALPEVDDF